jgi:hypothetical protein
MTEMTRMIGRTYMLHSSRVTVLARWNAAGRGTWPSGKAPRNVLIEHADGKAGSPPVPGTAEAADMTYNPRRPAQSRPRAPAH